MEGEGEGGKEKKGRGAVLWWIRARELARQIITKGWLRRREFYHRGRQWWHLDVFVCPFGQQRDETAFARYSFKVTV